jgi:site-specific DNA recombinase
MSPDHKRIVRCAIYTRKSSEEGLEQAFNSLDAQREACQAFIVSQRHEGWRPLSARYDDGGYSGGTMDRPALKRLLDDIEANKIDSIVVYKVDRLTRSLADFAKIVEALDARGVSFVSVTQQFNTTSSMGRLTLNVLLSFAQFEREVTGERIRDKIAASKRKGMWMGGTVPLGYDLDNRKLVVNPEEAKVVRNLFTLYLEAGCVSGLKTRLDQKGIKSKVRVSVAGARSGGSSYSRGALYQILKNRIYLGEIPHRDQSYPGQHEAIVSRDLWDLVQAKLSSDHQGRKNGLATNSSSPLVGLLRDGEGNRFTPSHTVKNGKHYRYYVCQSVIRKTGRTQAAPTRLPAREIENLVSARVRSFLQTERDVMDHLSLEGDTPAVTRQILLAAQNSAQWWNTASTSDKTKMIRSVVKLVLIQADRVELRISKKELRAILFNDAHRGTARTQHSRSEPGDDDLIILRIDAMPKRCGLEIRLAVPPGANGLTSARPLPSLLKAVARAHDWYHRVLLGNACDQRSLAHQTGLDEVYVGRILRCAFLAPDIVEAILDGRQPESLTLDRLQKEVPMSWTTQRRQLGFSSR